MMPQQQVSRLKALLFDEESRELGEMAQRLEALNRQLEQQTSRHREEQAQLVAERDALARRVIELESRVGHERALRHSVAEVVAGSLRDAEKENHRDLTSAMAPMVRRTFRAELRSQSVQDELASAMYPKLGEMIRRYLASAMRDMMETINRRLESGLSQNRLVLKLRSIATGRSMAELALADTQRFQVEEIYLIRRGSGELIRHWSRATEGGPARTGDNRDTLVSGFLTAITAFAEEAFAGDRSSLRALDLDEHRIYLRASPAHLLAAKCSGTAEAAVEQVLDGVLLELLASHQRIEAQYPPDAGPEAREEAAREHERSLLEASQSIEQQIGEAERTLRSGRASLRPLKIAAAIVLLPLLAYVGWQKYVTWVTEALQARAEAAIEAMPELSGYPVRVRVERGPTALWVGGLVPTASARATLVAGLRDIAGSVPLTEAITALPEPDLEAAITTDGLRRALDRAQRRLGQIRPELQRAASASPPGADRATLEQIEATVGEAASSIERTGPEPAMRDRLLETLQTALRQLRASTDGLTRLAAAAGLPAPAPIAGAPPDSAAQCAEELALAADRIGQFVSALEQARAAKADHQALAREMAELRQRLDSLQKPAEPSPLQKLEAFVRQNAIFFANNLEYRAPQQVTQVLAQLKELATPVDALIRIVGYTDEIGGAGPRNQTLSQQRAEKVLEDLVQSGVPRQRLVAVGRATAIDLAPRTGAGSANRRVEFEIGFRGEEATVP